MFSTDHTLPFSLINLSRWMISSQVICWVLGEYGTAYGKYSASYITGKLCDLAEAYSTDDTVKVLVNPFGL